MLTSSILEEANVSTTTETGPPALPLDNFAPVQRELTASGLVVHGELPAGLQGTLYRNGPNPRFPGAHSHWFSGDGMLHAITLGDGTASYRNRWVRTPKFLAEQQAGRALYRDFAGKLPDAPEWAPDDQGLANTNIVRHAGRLLALEEAHPPTEIDSRGLETRGYPDLGMPAGPFTAHPKIDPATGEMLFFGYAATGPFSPAIRFGVLDAAGALRRHEIFPAPYSSMVHDFMVTERHVLFPVLPLTGSLERAMRGEAPYAWEPEKGAYIGVMRRDGPSTEIRWFRGEACYAFHIMNAWEDGRTIAAEAMVFGEPPLFPRADGQPSARERQRAHLTRWTFDLDAGTDRFASVPLDELPGEFPRIDDRWSGLPHRHGWFACRSGNAEAGCFDGLAHRDRLTGHRQTRWFGPRDGVSEPVFAPRGPEDGDGWLLAVVWRAANASSELQVFEARDIESGPVAVVELPQRVPFGYHGNWISQEDKA